MNTGYVIRAGQLLLMGGFEGEITANFGTLDITGCTVTLVAQLRPAMPALFSISATIVDEHTASLQIMASHTAKAGRFAFNMAIVFPNGDTLKSNVGELIIEQSPA